MVEAHVMEPGNNKSTMIMMIMILVVSTRTMKLVFKFSRNLFGMIAHPTPVLVAKVHHVPPHQKPPDKLLVYTASTMYFIHNAKHWSTPGALVDRDANGGVAYKDSPQVWRSKVLTTTMCHPSTL